MARSNRARGASSTLSFFFIILSLVLLVPLTSARAPDAQPSPPVEGELICHTDNPAECYPKVFQATHEFQVIRDDQDIPNGLHIRMDMTTGRKEAKINVPDEENPALEGLPVDSSMIVVEPEEGESGDAPPIPFAAPVYQAFGQVKPPKEESPQFYTHLDFIKKGPGGADLPFDEALEFLEEISHDMYYGDKIAENPETVHALLCLMASPSQAATEDAAPRDQRAATIIAAALQNNPDATELVGNAWLGFLDAKCSAPEGGEADSVTLREKMYAPFVPGEPLMVGELALAAARAKARVNALHGLLRSPVVRDDFLANRGMDRLLEVLKPGGEKWAAGNEWEGAQRKVAHLLLDTFLEEEFGATKGIWPTFRAAETDAGKRRAARASDEQWIEAVRVIKDRHPGNKGHWSVGVLKQLEALHKAQLKNLPREDL
ncbi:hypothetical protein BN1708_006699 [Verticillium longisporum]|uniref:Nucleotide exchange factor SIL1 n=2 Tax=Verticillium longisporum TaxID=100787 RepID=A0A0G4MM46_VERLO|nr:hypothetical protein BN1708_006699 [Verticillium longisporum]